MKRALTLGVATLLACFPGAARAHAQSPGSPTASDGSVQASATAGTFSGRYKLALVASPSCQMIVRNVTVLFGVTESPVVQPPGVTLPIAQGTQVFGQAAAAGDATEGRFVLLRQVDHLHGSFGTTDATIQTVEGLRVYFRLAGAADATATSGGRLQAQGTAIGDLKFSRPGDDAPDTLGSCTARDLSWSLQPQ